MEPHRGALLIYATSCIAFSLVGIVMLDNYPHYAKYSHSGLWDVAFVAYAIHLILQGVSSFVNDAVFLHLDEIPDRFKCIRTIDHCMAALTLVGVALVIQQVVRINIRHYGLHHQYTLFCSLAALTIVAGLVSYRYNDPEKLRSDDVWLQMYLFWHTVWHVIPIVGGICIIAK